MAMNGTHAAIVRVGAQRTTALPEPRAELPESDGENAMRREREKSEEQEVVGIVISRGPRDQEEPRFSAYVWGPAPVEADGATKAA